MQSNNYSTALSFGNEIGFSIIVSFVVCTIFLIAIILLILLYSKSRRKHELELFEKTKTQLEEINKTKIEIQDQTLKEIGRELHDNIGQLLLVARIQLQDVIKESNNEKLTSLNNTTNKAMEEIRLLSKLINTDVIKEFGLLDSLKNQQKLIEKTAQHTVELSIAGTPFSITKNHELLLFRICQETISNALKYAGTNIISIVLDYNYPTLCITIADKGKGFDTLKYKNGNGIINMQNRAKILNATYSIFSEINKGTTTVLKYTNHD